VIASLRSRRCKTCMQLELRTCTGEPAVTPICSRRHIIQAVSLYLLSNDNHHAWTVPSGFKVPLALMLNQKGVNVVLDLWTFTIPR
jgi:hypothetical protein